MMMIKTNVTNANNHEPRVMCCWPKWMGRITDPPDKTSRQLTWEVLNKTVASWAGREGARTLPLPPRGKLEGGEECQSGPGIGMLPGGGGVLCQLDECEYYVIFKE